MTPAVKHKRMKLAEEMHAVDGSAVALDEFDPFAGRMVDANSLIGGIGYRLTARGWEPFKRTARGPVALKRNGSLGSKADAGAA